jgi:hypothetical protein
MVKMIIYFPEVLKPQKVSKQYLKCKKMYLLKLLKPEIFCRNVRLILFSMDTVVPFFLPVLEAL